MITMLDQPGRTMDEARRAGDWYMLTRADGRTLAMPGCRGLADTLAAAVRSHRWPSGEIVIANLILPGSSIGCLMVGDDITATLP